MSSYIDKALTIVSGDIVSVARGRGWQRAKVLKTLGEGMLLLKFRDGSRHKVSAEHVLTEDESKNFKRARGNTAIVRNKPVSLDGETAESEDDDEESKPSGFFSKLM
jgi:hypothetical protein